MSAAGDLGTDESGFGVEAVCVDLLQCVATIIVVTIAGGCGKVGGVDAVFLHGMENLALVDLRNLVHLAETLHKIGENGFAVFINFCADAERCVHFLDFHRKLSSFLRDSGNFQSNT